MFAQKIKTPPRFTCTHEKKGSRKKFNNYDCAFNFMRKKKLFRNDACACEHVCECVQILLKFRRAPIKVIGVCMPFEMSCHFYEICATFL